MKKAIFLKCMLLALYAQLLPAIKSLAGIGQPVILMQALDGSQNQIQKDSSRTVVDDKFNDASSATLIKPYVIQNIITFKINEASVYYLQTAFTASVRLELVETMEDGTVQTVDTTLSVNYDSSKTYTNRSSYVFKNAYQVQMTVLQVSTNAGWNVWNALMITNEIQSYPFYQFSCTDNAIQSISPSIQLDSSTNADELPVTWGNIIPADQYDLEWAYIDSSAYVNGVYNNPSTNQLDPSLIFANNASRVTVTGTGYNIPLFYDGAGYLFYRVRSVQVEANGSLWQSNWSSDYIASGGLGQFYFKGHQRNLNWQATTTFAEEGKRKTVVQYYDGSLHGRQTVTKDNTTDTTIVAETFYDYQGRPAIQVMPTPTLNTIIQYAQNFNVDINGNAYNVSDFDSLDDPSAYCSLNATAMGSVSGASQYYSPNNPQKTFSYNQFIPDAKNYPFTQVEYTRDNTGRISRQGGVGPGYQLGSGHETKYYYGTPNQRELDALFGTEVGDHSHYFKTMVRDANGQYSVSYADMHGRTIATALAGEAPSGLDKLSSNVLQSVTENLSDSNSNVVKDLSMESQKGLLVSNDGYYQFNYKLDPQSLQMPGCDSNQVCYDCLYNLEISLSDDCSNQQFGGQPFDTTIHNFSLANIDTACSPSGFSFSFSKYLNSGSYTVTKRLSISSTGAAYYRDSIFVKKNTCTSLQTLTAQQAILIANSNVSCAPSCQGCRDSLGTYQQFHDKFLTRAGIDQNDSATYSAMIQQAYQEALNNCNILCNASSEVDDIRNQMLLDMTPPSGQYANPDSSQNKYSIFFPVVLPDKDTVPYYQTITNYTDDFGNPDMVYDESTNTFVAPQDLDSASFIQKFKLSWAEALLPHHPEYCKLQQLQDLNPSFVWDRRFEAVDSYDTAIKYGYLNPTGLATSNNGTSLSKYNATGQADPDSLTFLTSYSSVLNQFNSELRYYDTLKDNSGTHYVSIWAAASASVKCGNKDTSYTKSCIAQYLNSNNHWGDDSAFTASMCPGDLDMAWRSFRQMYLDLKRKLINAQINQSCKPTADQLLQQGFQPHFTDAGELIAASSSGVTSSTSSGQDIQQQKDSLNNFYASNCNAYATYWFSQLKTCNQYDTNDIKNTIIPQLVAVCEAGSDVNHPYGASSVAPGSSNQYKSFEEVMDAYNKSHGYADTLPCNAYVITSPKPYDQQLIYSNKTVYTTTPDTCDCNQIGSVYKNYQAVAFHYTSFSDYLKKQFQTDISDSVLTQLLNACNNTGDNTCNYLHTPIALPPVLQCSAGSVCVSCFQVNSVNAQFVAKYPNIVPVINPAPFDSVQLRKNQLYEAFMNYHLGFSKHVWEYLSFLSSCGSQSFGADTVGSGISGDDTLISIKKQFINYVHNSFNNTVCADTSTWRVYQNQNFSNDDYTVTSIPNNTGVPSYSIFNNGSAKLPAGYPSVNYISYVHQTDTICLTGKYTAEARIRFNSTVTDTVHRMIGYFDSRSDTLANFFFQPNNPDSPDTNWRIAHWDMSASGALIKINKLGIVFPNAVGNTGEIDWVRLKDENGNIILFEDFNSFQQFASPVSGYQCSPAGNNRMVCSTCETAFQQYYNAVQHTNLTYAQIQQVYQQQGLTLDACPLADAGLTLCGTATPVFSPVLSSDSVSSCMDSAYFAVSKATELYNFYADSLLGNFDSAYRAKCMQAYKYESFTVTHQVNEYHYTLYYYDQGGNLVKTVPPEGVHADRDSLWLDSVATARASGDVKVPPHGLLTQYRYNTLNQVVAQLTPDITSQSNFWYDRLGRLVISQNAKQRTVSSTEQGRWYSYTLYDSLGRITEVGQIANAGVQAMNDTISRDEGQLAAWIQNAAANKMQITQTVYDVAYNGTGWQNVSSPPVIQRNLRNRVSYTSFTVGNNPANYNAASFYTYDAHGNVDTLVQDYGNRVADASVSNAMNIAGSQFKRIVYQYDLVSGKVNTVAYQPNQPDQFYHRYTYDAENRLIKVETSVDSIHWDQDAHYDYYRHGPLARTLLGEQQVQGLDYAYTLQGWLKGINSSNLNPNFDMGNDGVSGSANQYVARDAYGISLNYFTGDYANINVTAVPFPGFSSSFQNTADYKPLYNGNISAMITNIGKLTIPGGGTGAMLYNYTYDQLNRITAMDVFTGLDSASNNWNNNLTAKQDYKERVAYDANGNILTYLRNGYGSNLSMDNLTYNYNRDGSGNLLNNKLNYIHDAVPDADNYTADLKSQQPDNYTYDSIGNLITDIRDSVTDVEWNVYGKITSVTKQNGTLITYNYDAAGNRIGKTVTPSGGSATTTWYVRDASGNVMSIYSFTDSLRMTEQDVYGSSRLAVLNTNVNMQRVVTTATIYSSYRGFKNYELSNHLGNVLVTVTDKKIGVPLAGNSSLIDYFHADVVSANDYYPFGMQIPGRSASSGSGYRYGFNGQEKSPEIFENSTTAMFWEYDGRIGRRWNSEPKPNASLSIYSALGNNPVWSIDILGDTPTAHQAAQMAADSYNSFDKRTKIDGRWQRIENLKGVKFSDKKTGFQAALYYRTINGKTEYTFATAGTEPTSLKDWANNFVQPLGLAPQYDVALQQAQNIVTQLKGKEVTFTGHSLGGGEASLNALATGKAAITFNAAGLSVTTEIRYGVVFKSTASIQAFVIPGEAVDYYQGKAGLSAIGQRKWVHPWFGQMNGFTAYLVKQTPQTIVVRIKLHLMGAMFSALDKAGYNDKPIQPTSTKPYDPNEIHSTDDLKREANRWFHW
ncbi:MAG TPA: hypothetical protein VMT76_01800 [Puia sp.]|nr:hypothetical protein [Puia sp.]